MARDLSKLTWLPNVSAEILTQTGSKTYELNHSYYPTVHLCTWMHTHTHTPTHIHPTAHGACGYPFPWQHLILSNFSVFPSDRWAVAVPVGLVLVSVQVSPEPHQGYRIWGLTARRKGAHSCPWDFLQRKARPPETWAGNNRSSVHRD